MGIDSCLFAGFEPSILGERFSCRGWIIVVSLQDHRARDFEIASCDS